MMSNILFTDRTLVKLSQITIYKHAYRVELIKESPHFHPGIPFKFVLQFTHHDGTPAKGITGKVEVSGIGFETTATSDNDGLIKLELQKNEDIESMHVSVSVSIFVDLMNYNYKSLLISQFVNNNDGFVFEHNVDRDVFATNAYIKIELKSP